MIGRFVQAASIAIISFGLLASCAGTKTKLIAQWKDDAYQGQPAKIFVIGLSKEYGPRTLLEDEFVRQLSERGNVAIASYTVLPRDEKPDKEAVLAKVQEVGADVIIAVKFLKKETGDTHTPLRRYAVPQGFDTSWDSYAGYDVTTDVGVRDVSYDRDVITMETTVFQAATRKPIWSALAQITYQNAPIKQIKPFTTAIVKELAQERVVR